MISPRWNALRTYAIRRFTKALTLVYKGQMRSLAVPRCGFSAPVIARPQTLGIFSDGLL